MAHECPIHVCAQAGELAERKSSETKSNLLRDIAVFHKRIEIPWLGQLTFTYLNPSLPVEHRPSTTSRHRTLFSAALAIPDQLVHCCFSSWQGLQSAKADKSLYICLPQKCVSKKSEVLFCSGFCCCCVFSEISGSEEKSPFS